jgi:hypothetical protein
MRLRVDERFAPVEVAELLGCSKSHVGKVMGKLKIKTHPEALERRAREGYAARSATFASRREGKEPPKPNPRRRGIAPSSTIGMIWRGDFRAPGSSSCVRWDGLAARARQRGRRCARSTLTLARAALPLTI